MVCAANETSVNVGIPAVMLPRDAGETLEKGLKKNYPGKPYFHKHNNFVLLLFVILKRCKKFTKLSMFS